MAVALLHDDAWAMIIGEDFSPNARIQQLSKSCANKNLLLCAKTQYKVYNMYSYSISHSGIITHS